MDNIKVDIEIMSNKAILTLDRKIKTIVIQEINFLDEFLELPKQKKIKTLLKKNKFHLNFDELVSFFLPEKVYEVYAEGNEGEKIFLEIKHKITDYIYNDLVKIQFTQYNTIRIETYLGLLKLQAKSDDFGIRINQENVLGKYPLYFSTERINNQAFSVYRMQKVNKLDLKRIQLGEIIKIDDNLVEKEKITTMYIFYVKYNNEFIRVPIDIINESLCVNGIKMEIKKIKQILLISYEITSDLYEEAVEINCFENFIQIRFKESTEIENVYIKNRSKYYNENSLLSKKFMKVDNRTFTLYYSDLKQFMNNSNQLLDLFCEVNHGWLKHKMLRIKWDKKLIKNMVKYESNELQIIIFQTKIKSLSMRVIKPKAIKSEIKKIAILGSCYSRLAFSRKEYFNPHYKQSFEVTYTQFHSSIISIMSNKNKTHINTIKKVIEGSLLNEVQKKYILTDFSKDFFENLINSQSEYFLFDLYADGALSIMEIEDSFYTASYYFKNVLTDFFYKGYKINMIYRNQDNFLNLWYKSIDNFMTQLLTVYEEEKIILNSIRRVYTFEENNVIKKMDNILYGNGFEVAQVADYYIEIMEEYIISKYPKIKILDLNDLGFIGDKSHPDKLSTNHYQSGYYKAMITKLNEIIYQEGNS